MLPQEEPIPSSYRSLAVRSWAITSMSGVTGSLVLPFILFAGSKPEYWLPAYMMVFGLGLLFSFPLLFAASLFPGNLIHKRILARFHHHRMLIHIFAGAVAGIIAALIIGTAAWILIGRIEPFSARSWHYLLFAKGLLAGFSYGALHGLFTSLHPAK